MVIVIVSRELAITGLRLLAASKQVVLAAERFGKHKTISQITAIIALLLEMAYPTWGAWGEWLFGGTLAGRPWVSGLASFAQWVAVVLTFYSGAVYLWKNRKLYLEDI